MLSASFHPGHSSVQGETLSRNCFSRVNCLNNSSMEAVNRLVEITIHNAQATDLKGFGGPGRDRTDDLFHAMEPTLSISTTYKTPVAP